MINAALAELGGIDILVNNVGTGEADHFGLGEFVDISDEQWRELFNLNLFSTNRSTRLAMPSLLERSGAVISILSVNSRVPARDRSVTAAS